MVRWESHHPKITIQHTAPPAPPARLPRTRLLIQHASLMPLLLKEGRNEGWMNFPRGEGGMTDGSRADRSTERAGRQRDVETREGQADLSGDTGSGRAQKSALVPPEGQVFPVAVRVVVSSSSPRSPTRARRPECRCKVAQLRTDTEERNKCRPACLSLHSPLQCTHPPPPQ